MGVALALFALGTLVSGFAPTLQTLDLLRLATGALPRALSRALAYAGRGAVCPAAGSARPCRQRGLVRRRDVGGARRADRLVLSWRALFAAYGVVAGLVAVDAPDAGATRSHERRDTAWYPGPARELVLVRRAARPGAVWARVRRRRVATSTIGLPARFCSSVMAFFRMLIGGLLMIKFNVDDHGPASGWRCALASGVWYCWVAC